MAINGFDSYYPHSISEVRDALTLSEDIPIVQCDARDRASTKATLIRLVEHAIAVGDASAEQTTSTGGHSSWR